MQLSYKINYRVFSFGIGIIRRIVRGGKGKNAEAKGKRRLGRRGEKLARNYLKKQGYHHLHSNYTTNQGEIDLVMQQERTIVFVEVKARRDEDFVAGEAIVNFRKQKHIKAAARHFIHIHHLQEYPCRFDMVAVKVPVKGRPVIRHHENAFRVHNKH